MNRDDREVELLLRRMMQSEADAAEPPIATLSTPPLRARRRLTVGLAVGLAAVVVAVFAFAFTGRTSRDTVVASDSTTRPKLPNKPSAAPDVRRTDRCRSGLTNASRKPVGGVRGSERAVLDRRADRGCSERSAFRPRRHAVGGVATAAPSRFGGP